MRALVLALLLVAVSACRTGQSPDAGEGGIGTAVIHCGEKALHDKALQLLDDAASGLVVDDWEADLTNRAKSAGLDALTCAVLAVAQQAAHNFMASCGTSRRDCDHLEEEKADRGKKWLAKHPAEF